MAVSSGPASNERSQGEAERAKDEVDGLLPVVKFLQSALAMKAKVSRRQWGRGIPSRFAIVYLRLSRSIGRLFLFTRVSGTTCNRGTLRPFRRQIYRDGHGGTAVQVYQLHIL